MKRSERREKSTAAILEAAFAEFGERGYAGATVDGGCERGGISKGMMYHYYSGKDDLFCACVERMFSALGERLGQYLDGGGDISAQELLSGFFMCRERFFEETPNMRAVFEDAMLRTPPQLSDEISRLRTPVKESNRELLNSMLRQSNLRESVSEAEARRWFDAIDVVLPELFARFTNGLNGGLEEQIRSVLNMLLFGIFKCS